VTGFSKIRRDVQNTMITQFRSTTSMNLVAVENETSKAHPTMYSQTPLLRPPNAPFCPGRQSKCREAEPSIYHRRRRVGSSLPARRIGSPTLGQGTVGLGALGC
jgi:hypothetical protein